MKNTLFNVYVIKISQVKYLLDNLIEVSKKHCKETPEEEKDTLQFIDFISLFKDEKSLIFAMHEYNQLVIEKSLISEQKEIFLSQNPFFFISHLLEDFKFGKEKLLISPL